MTKTSPKKLGKILNINPARSLEATFKAKITSAILVAIQKRRITHAELARRSEVPRSAVTGILNGSLQKVTLNRLLRLLQAVELTADIKINEVA